MGGGFFLAADRERREPVSLCLRLYGARSPKDVPKKE